MMTLVALAIIAAYGYSAVSVLLGTGHDLLFELSTLIAIMLLGHWIEMSSIMSAQNALGELATKAVVVVGVRSEAFAAASAEPLLLDRRRLRVGDLVE